MTQQLILPTLPLVNSDSVSTIDDPIVPMSPDFSLVPNDVFDEMVISINASPGVQDIIDVGHELSELIGTQTPPLVSVSSSIPSSPSPSPQTAEEWEGDLPVSFLAGVSHSAPINIPLMDMPSKRG